jgi:hypothetical protein
MNLIHAIRRPAGVLLCLATVALASLTTAAPAALATPQPRPSGQNNHPLVPARLALRFHPSWTKHPPPPAHVHPLATSAIPGWQLTLMAVTIVLLAATLVTIAYPGPGRTAADKRTYRPTQDRAPRHADPQQQPAAPARPAPARHHHQAGPRP